MMTIEEIILENEWLIKKVASKFYNVDYEDLYQAGRTGLIKSYQSYQMNGDTKFSTYAYKSVFGEMYQLALKSKAFKVNPKLLQLYKKIEATRNDLTQTYGRVPSNLELSEFLSLELQMVEEALMTNTYISSMDEEENGERSIHETISYEENISLDDKLSLKEAIQELDKNKKQIIIHRYFEDLTQMEVAKKMQMTQAMVSRYEKQSLEQLRNYIGH